MSTSARMKGLEAGLEAAVSSGIASIHDALVTEELFQLFLEAHEAGALPVVVHLALQARPASAQPVLSLKN